VKPVWKEHFVPDWTETAYHLYICGNGSKYELEGHNFEKDKHGLNSIVSVEVKGYWRKMED